MIRNGPVFDDGTPMPTRYWLVGKQARLAVDRLEAAGGVSAAEAAVDPVELERAHRTVRRREGRRPSRSAGTGRGHAAAWGALGVASSACTHTTPGTSWAATTRSAAGWQTN